VGSLIGRGGMRVKQLATLSGAAIRFENEPVPTMFARGSGIHIIVGLIDPYTRCLLPHIRSLLTLLRASAAQRARAFAIVSGWISSSGMDTVPIPLELHGRVIGTNSQKSGL